MQGEVEKEEREGCAGVIPPFFLPLPFYLIPFFFFQRRLRGKVGEQPQERRESERGFTHSPPLSQKIFFFGSPIPHHFPYQHLRRNRTAMLLEALQPKLRK
jgi:hypothetical protein